MRLCEIALPYFFFQVVGPVVFKFIFGGRHFATVNFVEPVVGRHYPVLRVSLPQQGVFVDSGGVFCSGQFFIHKAEEEEHFYFCRDITGCQAPEKGRFVNRIEIFGDVHAQTPHFIGFFRFIRGLHKLPDIPGEGIAGFPVGTGKGQNGMEGVGYLWQAAAACFHGLLTFGAVQFGFLGEVLLGEVICICLYLLNKGRGFFDLRLS